MDSEDNFSPPLDGLSRGRKLHQMVTTLRNSDRIHDVEYIRASEEIGPAIIGLVDCGKIVGEKTNKLGIIKCNWWHMNMNPDWWEFEYYEVTVDLEMDETPDEDDEIIELDYSCGWYQQENESVDGITYFEERTENGVESEPFQTNLEAPRPLTRSIIDTHLPRFIRSKMD